MFDVESHLKVLAYGFNRSIDFGQDLMLAFVEEAVPYNDFGIFSKNVPELHEVAIRRPLSLQGRLNKLIQPLVASLCALKINPAIARRFLVMLAKASYA